LSFQNVLIRISNILLKYSDNMSLNRQKNFYDHYQYPKQLQLDLPQI